MQVHLNTFGTYVHVKDGMFEIRVPTEGRFVTHHLAAKKVVSLHLTVAGAISTDALRLALRHRVEVIVTERDGFPLGRFWSARPGSTTRIRKRQLEVSIGAEAVPFVARWLTAKLNGQALHLEKLRKHRKAHREALDAGRGRIGELVASLATVCATAPSVGSVADTLRGLEGTAGRLYFGLLSQILPEAYRFSGRSFRPAADAFNAFLNYGYGILYNRVEKALLLAGLNPFVGFMHRDDYNQKSLVFDFIEPYRVLTDRVVVRLFAGKKINATHYELQSSAVHLAKPGKELLVTALNDFLDVEKVRHGRRNRSRMNALQVDAHAFAQELIGENRPAPKIIEL